MSLESRWVDAIHARLLVRYGSRWLNLWVGVDPELVKADWARELHGITAESIQHALEHLPPDQPPTVSQFRAICIRRPETAVALPPPKADPARVAAAIRSARAKLAGRGPRAWIQVLRNRAAAGERLSAAQQHALRQTQELDPTATPDEAE